MVKLAGDITITEIDLVYLEGVLDKLLSLYRSASRCREDFSAMRDYQAADWCERDALAYSHAHTIVMQAIRDAQDQENLSLELVNRVRDEEQQVS